MDTYLYDSSRVLQQCRAADPLSPRDVCMWAGLSRWRLSFLGHGCFKHGEYWSSMQAAKYVPVATEGRGTAQEPWQAPTAALGWEATRYPALAERAPHISDGLGPGPHLDAVHGHDGVPAQLLSHVAVFLMGAVGAAAALIAAAP